MFPSALARDKLGGIELVDLKLNPHNQQPGLVSPTKNHMGDVMKTSI